MSVSNPYPRIVIAGMAGDSGKTLFSLGLLLTLKQKGLSVRGFKKGPDYIDSAWLSWASGQPARNLDSYLMGFSQCAVSFLGAAVPYGLNLIEGNRGLYDGADARGTHSTAALAKRLRAPVLLVVNATKVTRTAAAFVLGCRNLDPQVDIQGVVLNQVHGMRHANIIREAIETECGIRVIGILPRTAADSLLPARHLGLLTPDEHPRIGELENNLVDLVRNGVDLDAILALASDVPAIDAAEKIPGDLPDATGIRIGFLRDSALSFYYPENLEVLEKSGAFLIPISPLTAGALPRDLDALYIGGGFPETHGSSISANQDFLADLRHSAVGGLPIYAECGGLMLLSQGILLNDVNYPMSGVFPWRVGVSRSPQGHGYVELRVDRVNPFFPCDIVIRGHEFHYSRILADDFAAHTVCDVKRGTGCGLGRDGVVFRSVWASYTHLHALGTPEWGRGLLQAALEYSKGRLH